MTALLTDSLVNEAAEEMICKLFPGDERWAGTSPEYHRKGFIKGAFYARSIYEARLAEREATIEEITQKYHAAIARELRTIGREQEVRAGLVEALELCEAIMDEASFEYTNAYAATVAALATAKEIK